LVLWAFTGSGVSLPFLLALQFDLEVPDRRLAAKNHGHSGFFGKKTSGHSTVEGLTNDCETINQAQILG